MNTKLSLESYQKVKHNLQVWEDNGTYILFIPEYGVFAKNSDLNEGFKELTSEKEKYFQKLSEAGISSQKLKDLSLYTDSLNFQQANDHIKRLVPFVFKSIIVIALVLGLGSVGLVMTGNVLSNNMGRLFHKIEQSQPIEKVVSYIESLPEERIDKYRAQVHRLSIKFKPVIDEIIANYKEKPEDLFK